jgi:hypothetical protein
MRRRDFLAGAAVFSARSQLLAQAGDEVIE